VVESLCRAGARLARPGEFTLRAFLAGRMDLTQAEGVLGVIDAADQRQLQGALRQLAGGLAEPLGQLREQLLDLLADLEAGLDFADQDISFVERASLIERLEQAADRLAGVQVRIGSRTVAHDAPLVVVYGMPNVGKSTLCNALSGHDHAIVSDLSGTTRDYLMADVALGAVTVRLADTAGLIDQAADDPTHTASQEASRRVYQQADLRLLCLDATRPLSRWERTALAVADDRRLVIRNKCDRPMVGVALHGALEVSAQTGAGLEKLKGEIAERLSAVQGQESPVVEATALRCAESLRQSSECLDEALCLARSDGSEELIAGLLRGALDPLGMVAGQVYTEDLLDRVFGRFCIGK
jgi:tRNA modification GTPase